MATCGSGLVFCGDGCAPANSVCCGKYDCPAGMFCGTTYLSCLDAPANSNTTSVADMAQPTGLRTPFVILICAGVVLLILAGFGILFYRYWRSDRSREVEIRARPDMLNDEDDDLEVAPVKRGFTTIRREDRRRERERQKREQERQRRERALEQQQVQQHQQEMQMQQQYQQQAFGPSSQAPSSSLTPINPANATFMQSTKAYDQLPQQFNPDFVQPARTPEPVIPAYIPPPSSSAKPTATGASIVVLE